MHGVQGLWGQSCAESRVSHTGNLKQLEVKGMRCKDLLYNTCFQNGFSCVASFQLHTVNWSSESLVAEGAESLVSPGTRTCYYRDVWRKANLFH